jgi:hypothetical protein
MNKAIYQHTVVISDGTGIIKNDNEFTVKPVEILAENEEYIVLNDRRFQTLQYAKGKYNIHPSIDQQSICISTNDSCWGNRVTYSLYSFSRKRAATIRKEIEREIKDRFGWFVNGIDLSIIKDSKEAKI